MNTENKWSSPSRIGGAAGFALYLVVGLFPSMIFGKKVGLLLSNSILGVENQLTLTSKMLIGGGLLLGFVIGLFIFVCLGAVVAGGISHLIYYNRRIEAELAENGDKLHDLPPDSAPYTSQGPKKS
ncbi:MAG: hypothetical protein HY569_00910 [Candidatus Magasanikbacteria bacterium]|nr:hypothetical protein [Candidatus Magasanikbacteria bacterium]